MKKPGYAHFVESPRTIDDLMEPHPIEQETAYEIVKTVKLSGIDYENFITDMIADRQFIEDNAALCSQGRTWLNPSSFSRYVITHISFPLSFTSVDTYFIDIVRALLCLVIPAANPIMEASPEAEIWTSGSAPPFSHFSSPKEAGTIENDTCLSLFMI